MENEWVIQNEARTIEARFSNDQGLALRQLTVNGASLLRDNDSTPIAGPHIGERLAGIVPKLEWSRFPHLDPLRGDPLVDGVARYVPWEVEVKSGKLSAQLSSKSEWEGHALAELERRAFSFSLETEWSEKGVVLTLSHRSDTDAVLGFPLALPEGEFSGRAKLSRETPSLGLEVDDQGNFRYTPQEESHIELHAYPSPLTTSLTFKSEEGAIWKLGYCCANEESSIEIVRAKDTCLTFFTASHPDKPILTVNSLQIRIEKE